VKRQKKPKTQTDKDNSCNRQIQIKYNQLAPDLGAHHDADQSLSFDDDSQVRYNQSKLS